MRLGSRRLFPIIFSMTLAAIAACGPTGPSSLPLGRSFELRAGSSVSLDGGLTMSFDRVASDSRCPMDAFCVWAGDAIVSVTVSRDGQKVNRDLHTQANGSEATYSGYTIKLISLAPYPRAGRQIQPGDYVATLSVAAP